MAFPTRANGGRARLDAYASRVARGLRGGTNATARQRRRDRQDLTMEPANALALEVNPGGTSGGAILESGQEATKVLNSGIDIYEVTVACWFKRGAASWAGSFGGVLGASSDYNVWDDGFGLYISSDTTMSFFVNNYLNATTIAIPDDQEWHHLVCTWASEAAEYRVWLDGVEQITNGSPPAVVMDTTLDPTLKIAAIGDVNLDANNAFYSGHLDDVALWGRALSPYEVSWVYNQGRATANLDSPSAPYDCRMWYRFGDYPGDDPTFDTGVVTDLTDRDDNMTPTRIGARTGTLAFTSDIP